MAGRANNMPWLQNIIRPPPEPPSSPNRNRPRKRARTLTLNNKIRNLENKLKRANANVNAVKREIARLKRLKYYGQNNNKK